MGSIKGFIDWVKGEDVEDEFEEELPRQRSEEPIKSSVAPTYERSYERPYESAPSDTAAPRRGNKVVNINTTTQLAVVLVKPDRFENAAEIADHLKDKRTVVLNLEQTNKDANEGKIKKVANSTYIITPYNVDIMGDLIDELESSGMYF